MKDKYYKYYNPNPEGLEKSDCVIRAICAVTGLSWYEVYDKCCELGRKYCMIPNDQSLMDKRCEVFGLEKRLIRAPKKGQKSMTVQDFCKEHKIGKFILKTAKHNLAVVDGKYWDLYMNHGQKVYKYYELVEV